LKNHVVKKVTKFPEGTAGKLSCVSGIVALIWFLATICSGLFATYSLTQTVLLTSLHWDGLKNQDADWSVPFPQVVFCAPPHGAITSIYCYQSQDWFGDKSPLTPVSVPAGSTVDPAWKCTGFNVNGTDIVDPTNTVFCKLNATENGRFHNETARVPPIRLYLDEPGTDDFIECENCVDGIDGTYMIENTTTLAFFEGDVIEEYATDDDDDTVIDYRTTATSMPTQPQLGEISNMDIVLGFYTRDVWEYKSIAQYQAQFAGEAFGHFILLAGGCGVFAYGLYLLLSKFLILLIVGDDTSTATSTEKRALLG